MSFAATGNLNHNKSAGGVATISTTVTGLTAGNLIRVGISGFSSSLTSVTVQDTTNSISYALIAFHKNASSNVFAAEFYGLAASSGSIQFTATPNITSDIEIGAVEYSYASGATITPSTAVTNDTGGAGNTSLTSTAVTFSATDNWLLSGTFVQLGTQTWTAGTNFTLRINDTTSGNYNLCMEDYITTQAHSPLAATCSVPSGVTYAAIGVAYREVINAIVPSPSTIPANHAGNITLTLTGNGTSWNSGTTVFTTTGAGVSKISQSITSTTSATLTVITSSSTGTCTLGDGVNSSADLTVALATISVTPTGGGANLSTFVTLTGINTLWLSENPATLFSLSMVSGVSISSLSVISNTSATFNIVAGSSTGTVTITDNSTTSTTSFTIYTSPPGFTATPNNLPVSTAGQVVTLAGIGTGWSGSPFSLVGAPSGTSITAENVTNPTSATVTITSGAIAGSFTVFDGNYSATLTVSAPAIISAYVGRSPQLAYFFTTILGAQTTVTAVNSNPTIKVNGNSVSIAGPIWTNSTHVFPFVVYQLLCGALQNVLVQNTGHGYTSPSASSSGGITYGTPTLLNGGLNISGSSFISNGGTGYNQGGALIATDSTPGGGSGFVGFVTMSGGIMTSIIVESMGKNYTSGTTTLALSTEFGLGGSGAAFTAPTTGNGGIVNGMIGTVPIVSSPTNLTSAPTITVTDGGPGTGCVVAAEMSGPLSTDTVTFSASSGWLTTTAGGTIPASTNAPMNNYAGQLEPAFTTTPTMPLGINLMVPFGYTGGKAILQNILKGILAPFSGASNPTITAITDATGSLAVIWGVVNSSGQITSWVVQCGGINYTGPTAATVSAPATGGTTATLTGANFTVVNGVITAVSLGTAGSGYGGSSIDGHPIAINNTHDAANVSTAGKPGCNVPVQNTTLSGVNGVDGIGNPDMSGTWTYIADESNPTHPMTVRMYSGFENIFFGVGDAYGSTYTPGTLVGGSLIGSTWLFNVTRTAGNTGRLYLSLDVIAGATGTSAAWSHSNECLTQPIRGTGASQTPVRSNPMTPDANMVAWLTLNASQGCSVIRCWPFQDFTWWNNVVDSGGLRKSTDFTYGDSPNRYKYITISAIRSYNIWSGCTFTGTLTSSSATVSSISNTAGMIIGQAVTGTGIPSGTAIASIVNSSSITLATHVPFSGVVTNGSNSITGIASTSGMTVGDIVYGPAVGSNPPVPVIPPGTTIATIPGGGTSITISNNATASVSGNANLFYITPFSASGSGSQTLGYNSPYVWTNNGSYPNVLQTSGLSAGTISTYWGSTTPPPYYWVPQGNTSSNSLDWMGKGASGAPQEMACEFVTPSPHNLKTGQTIYEVTSNSLTNAIPSYDLNFNSGAGNFTITVTGGLFLSVLVTSSTTFSVVTQFSGNITKGHVANCIGSNSTAFNLTFRSDPGTNAHPYEAFCNLANAVPNCSLHTFAPPFATDACLTTLLTTIGSILTPGLKLYLESINEYWNSAGGTGGNYQNMYTLSGLSTGSSSISSNSPDQFYAWWTAHIQQIGVNLGVNIVRVFGGHAGVSQNTTNIINYANTYNSTSPTYKIKIDAFMSAPYIDVPNDSVIATMAASTYSNWNGSTAYETANPSTIGMYLDVYRHYTLYCSAKWITSNTSVIPSFNYSLAGQSGLPFAMTYECSPQNITPQGVSTTDPYMRGAVSHDCYFHQYMSDVDKSLHLSNQNSGCGLEVSFNIQNVRHAANSGTNINGTNDTNGAVVWGDTTWAGMPAGLGNGTLDESGNNTVNTFYNYLFNSSLNGGVSQDLANASPKLYGWRNWAAQANSPPVGSITLSATMTTGVIGNPVTGFTVASISPMATTVNFSDGSTGGSFSPSFLSLPAFGSQSFSYTPEFIGLISISISDTSSIPISGSPVFLTVSTATITLSATSSTTTTVGSTITGLTVTPSGPITGVVNISDGGWNGTITPPSLTFSNSSTPQTFTYTQTKHGSYPISISNTTGYTNLGNPIIVTFNQTSYLSQPLYETQSTVTAMTGNVAYKIVSSLLGHKYIIQNTGSSNIYLGDSNVSASLGILVPPGGFFPSSSFSGILSGLPVNWYALSTTTGQVTVTISVQDVFLPFYSRTGNN